ncbi:hypothetical protein EAE96_009170 [Botrytis aclada]|nr:hypothetical protein EAE96_009170 [Botrytis aclada]
MPGTLDGLPGELIIRIGLFLPRKSLARLTRCSSHYYALCIELLYSHCTVKNRKMLKALISIIVKKSIIGPSIRWLDLRKFDSYDLCDRNYCAIAKLDLFEKAKLVQKNLFDWNISDWKEPFWRKISSWALMIILFCLVPQLRVLGFPAEVERGGGLNAFSGFIARLAENQRTTSPDRALRVLANLESVTIGTASGLTEIADLHHIMPFMTLRSVKRFRVFHLFYEYHKCTASPRVIRATPIPNIQSLEFHTCFFTGEIAAFLGRFTGIQRIYLGQVEQRRYIHHSKMPRSVEKILEGLSSSKDSLEYVDVRDASRIPDGQSVSLSRFKRLQILKLEPSPSMWSSENLVKPESRLINSFPPGLWVLVCTPFYRESDVVNLEQLYELVAKKETYAPELREIELIWDANTYTFKCEDCENYCELSEKIPFFTKLIAECKAKNINILWSHPLIES